MAEDTEKRFHSIMNKLFQSPKSKLPLSSDAQKSRAQKRPYSSIESHFKGDISQGHLKAAQAPPCRPWDRSDLMRRLATFKSMRWFAKPKAVDAVNCARRGWVNVDFDIIACEVCGARLQFSTPSAWNQQQVEKAALVFSLKLDTGHKLLCPWIDNACDESLGLFRPMPAPMLVDQYKERSSALLRLSALPLLSVSAIESMSSPLLKPFLKHSIAVECDTGPNNSSWTENPRVDMEALSGHSYYQALRLLSLCGWEPRQLPYVVDCGDQSKSSDGNTNITDVSHGSSGDQNNKLCVYVSGSGESIKDNEDLRAINDYYDPNSTVLDCQLCGASIGLWAFATVQRPLEMVRVVGSSEIGGAGDYANESTTIENHVIMGTNDISPSKKVATSREPTFNLTIAGGPPPTKQNFRAMVSLPVIGRNLRARFSCISSEVLNRSQEGHTCQTVIAEVSSDNLQSETTGPKDNACTTNTNGALSETPLAIVDETTIDQQMQIDSAASTKDMSIVPISEQRDGGVREITKTPLLEESTAAGTDKGPRSHSADQKMDFDPIRQHRHFCPWVTSTDTTAPGWRQTLSALQKEKVFSLPDNEASPSSPSFIKVDDPITSIRRLFESPPAKKSKTALT